MAAAAPKQPSRPLSPHLQIWRWHATMAASIAHRASGVALYAGLAGLSAWLMALAAGPEAYGVAEALIFSWFGQLALYALVAAIAYHAANGVRHLLWDAIVHLEPRAASASAVLVFVFALAAPAALWLLMAFAGAS